MDFDETRSHQLYDTNELVNLISTSLAHQSVHVTEYLGVCEIDTFL